jgi:hypothetical protein
MRNPFSKSNSQQQPKSDPLDDVVLNLRDGDVWTLRDAVRGVQIFGAIGSGKSSGSGQTIAHKFLIKGYGGIVLTGKKDELAVWENYATAAGREHDLIVFSEEEGYKFNPLTYEMNRPRAEGGGNTENMAAMFTGIVKLGDRITGGGGGGGSKDPFWDRAFNRLLKAMLDALKLADEPLTVANMVRLMRGIPAEHNIKLLAAYRRVMITCDVYAPDGDFTKLGKLDEFPIDSYVMKCLYKASRRFRPLNKEGKSVAPDLRNTDGYSEQELRWLKADRRTYEHIEQYFINDFPKVPERTRGSIAEMFFSFSDSFRNGVLADQFMAAVLDEKILPERTFEGKIIVLQFPVKTYLTTGVFAQSIYKKIWQQAVERRTIVHNSRPVFMWVDEAQYFLSEDDMMFQTTARSSRACTVMLTQNISNYYAVMGGSSSKARVDSLLGNLVTKIFHANNDAITNEWAARLIGKRRDKAASTGQEKGGRDINTYDEQVTPEQFTRLKTGGELKNKSIVEGYITSVEPFISNGKNYKLEQFKQAPRK